MKQIIVIGGGDTYATYAEFIASLKSWRIDISDYLNPQKDWKSSLQANPEFEVIRPDMPNKKNSEYEEWKIWFEKFIPFMRDDVILVGHSLGASFLSKYLAQNTLPKKIKAVILVAAAYGDRDGVYKAATFQVPDNLDNFSKQVPGIILYHSKDDRVVPVSDAEIFSRLLPSAQVKIYEDRGHFNMEEFPEIVQDIQDL